MVEDHESIIDWDGVLNTAAMGKGSLILLIIPRSQIEGPHRLLNTLDLTTTSKSPRPRWSYRKEIDGSGQGFAQNRTLFEDS